MRSYILIAILLIQKPAEFFGAKFDREAHHPPGVSKLCDISYPWSLHRTAFSIRCGDNTALDVNIDGCACNGALDGHQLIGIIDVRSKAEADYIILTRAENEYSRGDMKGSSQQNQMHLIDQAIFSSESLNANTYIESSPDDTTTQEEEKQNQAAAAALTVGSSCNTVYLLLTYDFKEGKTVLERTLGGIKLMSMVDGVRRRWSKSKSKNPQHTKIVILIIPSNTDKEEHKLLNVCKENDLFQDLSTNTEWKSEGIQFLVDRLKTYFELGGDEYKGVNPFGDFDILYLNEIGQESLSAVKENECKNSKRSDANHMLGISKKHLSVKGDHIIGKDGQTSRDQFRTLIESDYQSFGGLKGSALFKH